MGEYSVGTGVGRDEWKLESECVSDTGPTHIQGRYTHRCETPGETGL